MASSKAEPSKIDADHVGTPGAPNEDQDRSEASDEEDSQSWDPFDDDFAEQTPGSSNGDAEGDDSWVRDPNNPEEMSRWTGQPSIRGSSDAVRMILLNFCTLGITFTWGVEMAYCTPYLLSLGLTKSKTSMVWIAGPLSGLIVQPIVGAIADEWKSKYGRRRPFILIGSVIVAICMLTLGYTREITSLLISDEKALQNVTIFIAVIAIYAVDFSVNAVMSAARSLVVDTLPISKQQAGAAWGSRVSSVGHMMSYISGALDLVGLTGSFLGSTQFQKLTIIATITILVSAVVTCWAVTERVLVAVRHDPRKGGRFKFVRQIWSTLLHLPPRIQAICWAQFWSWIGWFPFLFYNTLWVGETYYRYDAPQDAKESGDSLGGIGRVGSTALAIYSVITFFGAWLLPLLVRSPDDEGYTRRPPESLAPWLEKFSKYKPDLLTTWMIGHGMFAASMYLAPFAMSFRFATALVCICGLPWTIAMWAPPAFLGVEVNRLSGATEGHTSYRPLSVESVEMSEMHRSSDAIHLEHGPDEDGDDLKTSSTGELSGVYFGILNIYTTLPQFVGNFISTIVFAILEPGKSPELSDAPPEEHHSTDGPNAVAVCLFIGAISATVAIFATRRLRYL